MILAGIDEAGRGCVIGPLVICGVAFRDEQISHIKHLQIKDSKKISPRRREHLYQIITKHCENYVIEYISAKKIDNRERNALSLNDLEISKMIDIINRLNAEKVYIDAIQSDILSFRLKIESRLNKKIEIIAENKADEKYLTVSAASILAKVSRDREIERLKEKLGDFGSGYPSDPRTKNWLEEFYKKYRYFPAEVRESWYTVDSIKKKYCQGTLNNYL